MACDLRLDRNGASGKVNKRGAVFLDRDGVVNEEINYLSDPEQVYLILGASQAIRLLNRNGVPVIVVTNQSGVAMGYLSEKQLSGIHRTLSSMLAQENAHVDRFYYCPHHPIARLDAYRLDCECRKPRPGLLLRAARDFDLDLPQSYMIGDKVSDLVAGLNSGCRVILVQTGYGAQVWQTWSEDFAPDFVARDLLNAVRWILAQTPGQE